MANSVAKVAKPIRPSVLILCEGSCTEPNYLGALVREMGLTSVQVPRDHDTDPLNLVKRAIIALKDKKLARAYVVFDRDQHLNFHNAVGLATQHPFFGSRLFIIRSYPSFEVWLLFHFERCRSPFDCQQAINRLKSHCPDYAKGGAAIMDEIIQYVEIAIENADFAYVDAYKTGEMNPSTEMQKLIRYLQSI